MGLARHWGVFNAETADLLPLADVDRIKREFVGLFGNHDQPVVKIPLEIVKVGTRLDIIPYQEHQAGGQVAGSNEEQAQRQHHLWPAPEI